MTATCRAANCGAPTPAFLCGRHARELQKAIAELPAALTDLQVTITRQAKVENPPHPTATPEADQADTEQRMIPARLRSPQDRVTLIATPLPVDLTAAHLHALAVNAVTGWTRHLCESRGIDYPGDPTPFGVCAWLVAHSEAIRHDEAAGEMHHRLTSLRAELRDAVDRHDPEVYAGRCDTQDVRAAVSGGTVTVEAVTCGAHLLAAKGAEVVTCRVCGTDYKVAERRERLLQQLADRWERPHKIANALTTLDVPVAPETVRKWIQRDREAVERWKAQGGREPDWPLILQRGIDDDGRAVFRVGDVQARIEHVKARDAERKSA